MQLSVVVPCFNELNTLPIVIRQLRQCPIQNLEIIVVDDASTDGTRELFDTDLKHSIDKIILHDHNQGKGAALRSGFKAATGDFVVVQDADLEYDPNDFPKLLEPLVDGKADVVFGSRFMTGESRRVLYYWHSLGNKFLTTLSNCFTNVNLSDMETCYKMFKRDVIQRIEIRENRFGVEPEVTAKIARMGCAIYEVGISYNGRTYAEGKKIGWKDGVWAIYAILKYGLFKR